MDDLSVRNKTTAAALAAAAKNAKAGKTGSSDFASFLVFGSGNMNTTMSMKSNSSQNDAVYDDGGNAGYDHSYHSERDTRTERSRDDVDTHDRSDDHDYRRDDAPRSDARSDDSRDPSDHGVKDDHRGNETASNNEHDSNDNSASQENAASDQSQSTSQDNTEVAGEQQGQTTTNANSDNVGNKMAQVAADTFTQGSETEMQTAANPAMAAMAGQQHSNATNQQGTQNRQTVQNIDANAGSNKDLFSNGWQNNAGQNTTQNTHNNAQGQQQGQAGLNTQQAVDPMAQGQLSGEAQKQAAELAKKLGPNQRAQVNVNVTNQADNTSSTLSQNLTNATQVAAEASNPASAATKQNAQKAGANAQTQNMQVAANTQTQNVQQNNTQNTQNQSFQSMVGDVKGAAKTQTVQQPQAVTPEAGQSAATAGANKTAQTQPTTESKNVAQHKPEVHTTAKPEEISVEISKAAKAGLDRIKIQLKPLELGRIEVQLEMSGGKVVTTIVAERPETLQMLKNDAGDLAKSLTEAGLNMGDMAFNLKHENGEGKQAGDGANGNNFADADAAAPEEEELLLASEMELLAKRVQERAAARGGIDLSA